MKKLQKYKNDLILSALIAAAGILIASGYYLMHQEAGNTITITVDGTLFRTLSLSSDTMIDIPGANGGSNRLVIKNGQASITEADCPDKLCIHQTAIQHNGESLVCLPHKVIVKVSSRNSDKDLDGVAR